MKKHLRILISIFFLMVLAGCRNNTNDRNADATNGSNTAGNATDQVQEETPEATPTTASTPTILPTPTPVPMDPSVVYMTKDLVRKGW